MRKMRGMRGSALALAELVQASAVGDSVDPGDRVGVAHVVGAVLVHLQKCLLQQILGQPIPFDPYAPETSRRQQILGLREQLMRKAG